MVELRTELPEEIVGWLSDAASRFNVTRSEIVQRALEQYLGSMAQVQATYDQSRQTRGADAAPHRPDTHHKKANCPYQECPFEDACPGESCPL